MKKDLFEPQQLPAAPLELGVAFVSSASAIVQGGVQFEKKSWKSLPKGCENYLGNLLIGFSLGFLAFLKGSLENMFHFLVGFSWAKSKCSSFEGRLRLFF